MTNLQPRGHRPRFVGARAMSTVILRKWVVRAKPMKRSRHHAGIFCPTYHSNRRRSTTDRRDHSPSSATWLHRGIRFECGSGSSRSLAGSGCSRHPLSSKLKRCALVGSCRSEFLFGHQLWDNVFRSLTTGVLVWTAYEVGFMWAYANGVAPSISFDNNPLWFIVLIFLTPYWAGFYFYTQHRILHWPPLYRTVHIRST